MGIGFLFFGIIATDKNIYKSLVAVEITHTNSLAIILEKMYRTWIWIFLIALFAYYICMNYIVCIVAQNIDKKYLYSGFS